MHEQIPVHVIWGRAPQTDVVDNDLKIENNDGTASVPLETEIIQKDADFFVMRGVSNAFNEFLGRLDVGGTLSLQITRGREPSDDEQEPPTTTASFVIDNRNGQRHVWDYTVERRKAVR